MLEPRPRNTKTQASKGRAASVAGQGENETSAPTNSGHRNRLKLRVLQQPRPEGDVTARGQRRAHNDEADGNTGLSGRHGYTSFSDLVRRTAPLGDVIDLGNWNEFMNGLSAAKLTNADFNFSPR